MPQGKLNTSARYMMGLEWFENSCAVDVTLFCALQLDIGRTFVDQLHSTDVNGLNLSAFALRHIIARA